MSMRHGRSSPRPNLGEDDLACGPHPPMHGPSAEALRNAGVTPSRIHNNCSGKHGGLLAFTRQSGWNTSGYHESSVIQLSSASWRR